MDRPTLIAIVFLLGMLALKRLAFEIKRKHRREY